MAPDSEGQKEKIAKSGLILNKKGDSPQRAQRKIKIKQGNKLLFSALLRVLVK
jgi:hypothetical protein